MSYLAALSQCEDVILVCLVLVLLEQEDKTGEDCLTNHTCLVWALLILVRHWARSTVGLECFLPKYNLVYLLVNYG